MAHRAIGDERGAHRAPVNSDNYSTGIGRFDARVKAGSGRADNSLMHWMFVLPLAFFIISFLLVTTRVRGTFTISVQTVKGLVEFARDLKPVVADYLKVNWSGQPEDLHRALGPLLDKAREMAATRGITMDEDLLRQTVSQIILAQRVVKRSQLAAAMDSVERPTPRAA